MHQVSFFPTGNADCCWVKTRGDRVVIYDFADMRDRSNADDKRIDLEAEIKARLGKAREIEVLAFSHLDTDHTKRSTEVFELRHAAKYQGGDRIKVKTIWVPAAAILEQGLEDETRVLRQEARHRLRQGSGVRVFSRPEALDDWLHGEGIDPASRRHLITDAGRLCPEFTLANDGLEFFVHSPFAEHCADGSVVVRNSAALFMQATFHEDGATTRVILAADVPHGDLDEIIRMTRLKKNDDRLLWDIINIPHHSSYLSLAADKGRDVTEPGGRIKWLYETQGAIGGTLVSTSCPIPTTDTIQPPHRQAAAYYRRVAKVKSGTFAVTMESPNSHSPTPLDFTIDRFGATMKKVVLGAGSTFLGGAAPRSGAPAPGA